MNERSESRASNASEVSVPKAAVGRLSRYLRQLERFQRDGRQKVSSRHLGEALGITDAQVRKDLGYFGQFGHAGIGYPVADLIQAVRRILGTHREWPVALVGFGNLGRALVGYRGFRRQGFSICAIFDVDPGKIGQSVDSIRIEPIASLARRVNEQKIELGIIAVPAESAQSVVDALVAAGVCGILNFAPALLSVPEHLSVISVDLAVHLEMLSYQVQTSRA